MAYLELKNVSKSYGERDEKMEVLQNINLSVEEGEFICIVGFSGSGKTTLIKLIEGLIFPDEGEVLINGEPVTGPTPDKGIVFQNYSLLPWLSVYGNVLLAIKQVFPEFSKKQQEEHVKKFVEMVNLTPALNKIPRELSGGMRQRVSVARALAMNPKILLLDEPLSALDALTRGTLQMEIEKIWEADKKTVVMITNDVDEAILLADRIITLNPGPNASFGPEYKVELSRPRDKVELNSDPYFRELRTGINKYLLGVSDDRKKESTATYQLPDLKPKDLRYARWPISAGKRKKSVKEI